MKILITGSKGVIGSKLSEVLKEKGHDVFGLDLFHCDENYGHGLGKVSNDNYFRCDISEYRQVERIVNYFNPDPTKRTNIRSTQLNVEEVKNLYDMGFRHFKLQGRALGASFDSMYEHLAHYIFY